MATFNVFGPTKLNDIRVGYIDPKKGLVEGVTICDANSYAKLNPGTQFIFRNREEIQYLNINEVNALTQILWDWRCQRSLVKDMTRIQVQDLHHKNVEKQKHISMVVLELV